MKYYLNINLITMIGKRWVIWIALFSCLGNLKLKAIRAPIVIDGRFEGWGGAFH